MDGVEGHLVLDGLSAVYGASLAVDRVNLAVGRGELVALLGPSGCGKTTSLRMVAGFVAPSRGRVLVGGRDLTGVPAHKRNIGVVFQSYALFPHLTVLENVAFGLRMRHQPREQRRSRALAMLRSVGLESLAQRYPHQLSGGQQQRVALARALVIEPSILLLDEPLSNLDAHLRAEMRQEIRELQQRLLITTLFVTHDQEEALALADRVAVMQAGRLTEVGAPKALCDQPADPFTASFLGARTVISGEATDGVFIAPGLRCQGAPAGARQIVLRAARLRFAAVQDGPLDLQGQVQASAFLGDRYETTIISAVGPVRLLTPSDTEPPPPGSACFVQALAGGVSFIRPQGA